MAEVPANWKDLRIVSRQMIGPDGKPVSAMQHLLMAAAQIAVDCGRPATGRTLMAAAEAAEAAIGVTLDLNESIQ